MTGPAPRVRTYACERCWENKCAHCGSMLFSDNDDGACAMCGTPHGLGDA